MKSHFRFYIFAIIFRVSCVNTSYSLCGSWQTYTNEKCIKILDEEKLLSVEDGMKSCSQIDNSSELLTIDSKEEQEFISEYLFKTNKLVDNVWIGLRNRSKSFEWTDSHVMHYSNWKTGYPNNKPDFKCVQLESENCEWTNEPCHKKNIVICQKLAQITISDLLQKILETKNGLKKTEEDLEETKIDFKGTKERLHKTEEDLIETKEDLKRTKEKLNKTEELLNKSEDILRGTRIQLNEIFNVVFNNKISHYQLFTDLNGKNKAFIIPLSALKKEYSFDDSVNLCKSFNSTLIEIESIEKQLLLESFLNRLGFESNHFNDFWISGQRESSGKWKWSDKEFNFTNWGKEYPIAESDNNNICFKTYFNRFGKWENYPKKDGSRVVCEYAFGF